MQIFPTEEQTIELLETCGKKDEEDFISFELFARSIALLLEDNLDKVTTSSQMQDRDGQDQEGYSENQVGDSQLDQYGGEDDGDEAENVVDPYYDEYSYAEAATKQYQ